MVRFELVRPGVSVEFRLAEAFEMCVEVPEGAPILGEPGKAESVFDDLSALPQIPFGAGATHILLGQAPPPIHGAADALTGLLHRDLTPGVGLHPAPFEHFEIALVATHFLEAAPEALAGQEDVGLGANQLAQESETVELVLGLDSENARVLRIHGDFLLNLLLVDSLKRKDCRRSVRAAMGRRYDGREFRGLQVAMDPEDSGIL